MDNITEKQLDQANNRLAGLCKHCGAEPDQVHDPECVFTLNTLVRNLQTEVQTLKMDLMLIQSSYSSLKAELRNYFNEAESNAYTQYLNLQRIKSNFY
jgi:hypothetical protein